MIVHEVTVKETMFISYHSHRLLSVASVSDKKGLFNFCPMPDYSVWAMSQLILHHLSLLFRSMSSLGEAIKEIIPKALSSLSEDTQQKLLF